MAVKLIDCESYRGFTIGYVTGKYGIKACWRSIHGGAWKIGHIYVDRTDQIEKLAHECIDFDYKVETEELLLGRKLTLEEVTALAKP